MGRVKKWLVNSTGRLGMKALETQFYLAKVPGMDHVHPWFKPENLNVSFLPINEDIQVDPDVPLPIEVLKDFIHRASHRVIYDYCGCREVMSCKKYSKDIGCLLMGQAALEANPNSSHEASVDEALEHAQTAVEKGLVPIIGKARIDNFLFQIKNKKQLLSVCFCCECCCVTRFARHIPLDLRAERLRKLEGLSLEVGDDCNGCGACAAKCVMGTITIEDDRAVIGEGCVGCGRCASLCSRDAITVSLDNPAFLEEASARIESLVDIG